MSKIKHSQQWRKTTEILFIPTKVAHNVSVTKLFLLLKGDQKIILYKRLHNVMVTFLEYFHNFAITL